MQYSLHGIHIKVQSKYYLHNSKVPANSELIKWEESLKKSHPPNVKIEFVRGEE